MKRPREAAAQPRIGPENSKNTTERLAALDLGTHAAKLLVASATWSRSGLGLEPLMRAGVVTRLGAGGGVEGRPIPATAVARAERAIGDLMDQARPFAVRTWVAAGPGVLRRASNGRAVARRLAAALGSPIPVLHPETEAALSLLGARAGAAAEPPLLGVDLGGGSTELIYLGAESRNAGSAFGVRSLDLGCLQLAERYLTPGRGDQGVKALRQALARALPGPLLRLPSGRPAPCWLAIGGTATALATMDLGLPEHDPGRVHGHRLTAEAVAELGDLLLAELAEGHGPARGAGFHRQPASVLLAGAILLRHLMAMHSVREVVVSPSGLRQGLLLGELLSRGAADPRRSPRRAIELARSALSLHRNSRSE